MTEGLKSPLPVDGSEREASFLLSPAVELPVVGVVAPEGPRGVTAELPDMKNGFLSDVADNVELASDFLSRDDMI